MKIGIDPGNSGAIAFLEGNVVDVVDMPLMANGKKQQINAHELGRIIESRFVEFDKTGAMAYVERVSAMPAQGRTQGAASMFNFGMGYGVIQGVLAALQIPYTLVTPQKWKKAAGLVGKDKDNARTLAQQLYPAAPLGRKKDIGRADAILIARFGVNELEREKA